MDTGTIVQITERHSGFIRRKGVKEHLFFHEDDVLEISFSVLKKGDKLSFSVVESLKGPYAVEVRKA